MTDQLATAHEVPFCAPPSSTGCAFGRRVLYLGENADRQFWRGVAARSELLPAALPRRPHSLVSSGEPIWPYVGVPAVS